MCWGPAIDVDVETAFISIAAAHPLMDTMCPHGCGLFQRDNEWATKQKRVKAPNKFEVLIGPLNSTVRIPVEHSWACN